MATIALTEPTTTQILPSSRTLAIMTVFSIGVSVVAGLVAGFIYAQQIASVILIALAAGIVGMVLRYTINVSKLHQPRWALFFAIVAASITYTAYFGFGVYDVWRGWLDYILVDNPRLNMNHQETEQFLREIVDTETGLPLIPGLITIIAQDGVYAGVYKLGFTQLDSTGTVIYWLIEYVVAVFITVRVSISAAKRPFCVSANQWTDMNWVGYVSSKDDLNFLDAARGNIIDKVINLIHENPPTRDYVVIHVGECGALSGLLQVSRGREGGDILVTEITHEQYELLMQKRAAHLENV